MICCPLHCSRMIMNRRWLTEHMLHRWLTAGIDASEKQRGACGRALHFTLAAVTGSQALDTYREKSATPGDWFVGKYYIRFLFVIRASVKVMCFRPPYSYFEFAFQTG